MHSVDSLRKALSRALRPYGMDFIRALESSGRVKIITKDDAARLFGVGREYIETNILTVEEMKEAGALWDGVRKQWYRHSGADAHNSSNSGVIPYDVLAGGALMAREINVQSVESARIEPVIGDPRQYFGYSVESAKAVILSDLTDDAVLIKSVSAEAAVSCCAPDDSQEHVFLNEIQDSNITGGFYAQEVERDWLIDDLYSFEMKHRSVDEEYGFFCRDDDIPPDYYQEYEAYEQIHLDELANEHVERSGEPAIINQSADRAAKHTAAEKIYISVPYAEKDEAKSLGAKWDKDNRSWYFEGNPQHFEKWISPTTNDTGADPEILHSIGSSISEKTNGPVAFYNKNDRIAYFIADAIPQHADRMMLRGIVLHEISVHALNLCRSESGFSSVKRSFIEMRDKGDAGCIRAFEIAIKANPGLDRNSEKMAEEAMGYYVESNPSMPISKKFMCMFREALRHIGNGLPVLAQTRIIRWADNLSGDDIVYFSHRALKSAPVVLLKENVGRVISDNPFDFDSSTSSGTSIKDIARRNPSESSHHIVGRESLAGLSKKLFRIDSDPRMENTYSKEIGPRI